MPHDFRPYQLISTRAKRTSVHQFHHGLLVEAQIAGLKYLVVRDKTSGKFLRVGALRAATLNPDEELIEVWEKNPNVQSYADLMNRVLGEPTESVELTGQDGRPLEIRWQGAETENLDRPVRV